MKKPYAFRLILVLVLIAALTMIVALYTEKEKPELIHTGGINTGIVYVGIFESDVVLEGEVVGKIINEGDYFEYEVIDPEKFKEREKPPTIVFETGGWFGENIAVDIDFDSYDFTTDIRISSGDQTVDMTFEEFKRRVFGEFQLDGGEVGCSWQCELENDEIFK